MAVYDLCIGISQVLDSPSETEEAIADAAPEDEEVEEEQMQHEDQDDESVVMDEVPTFDSEHRIMNLDRPYLLT